MALSEEKYNKRKLRTSYVSTIVSITLVLFMLGLLGLLLFHARKLSDYMKENIGFSIIIKDKVNEDNVLVLRNKLAHEAYVKSAEYISRDEAARILTQQLGEDFVGFMGYNPLLPSIDLSIRADYATIDSIASIEKRLLKNPDVKELYYQKSLVEEINKNLRRISIVILGFSALLLLIAIALINNTIRLSVYSRRFLIRSMQLVGATQGFIRHPFIMKGIVHGMISSAIALTLLAVVLYFAQQQLPGLVDLTEPMMIIYTVGLVFLLGFIITWISTFFAVRKFLNMKTDLLHY